MMEAIGVSALISILGVVFQIIISKSIAKKTAGRVTKEIIKKAASDSITENRL